MVVRIGLIGAGMICLRHARVLAKMPGVKVAAIVDIDLNRATEVAAEFGATPAASVADVLPLIDAAYVLTPPRGRVGVIRTLAQAGKPIFCEKPLAATVEEGEEIQEVVRDAGIPFMMGFMRRYAPAMVRVKEILKSGALGEITQISYQRIGNPVAPPGNWRNTAATLCGMTVESVSHDVDLLRWLVGDVSEIAGHVLNLSGLNGYDDNMVATFKFESGTVATIQASWTSRLWLNAICIIGTKGALMIDGTGEWRFDRLRVSLQGGSPDVDLAIDQDEAGDLGMVGENEAFVAALADGGPKDFPDVDDGLATLIVSTALKETLATRPTQGIPHDS